MKLLYHGMGIYGERAAFGPAQWPHHDLLAVREGGIVFQTGAGHLRMTAGDAVWIPAGTRFWGVSEAKRTVICVGHFRGRNLKAADSAVCFEAGVGYFRGGVRSRLASELMRRLDEMHRGGDTLRPPAEDYFAALLAEVRQSQRAASEESWIEGLEQWSRKHLSSGIGIRELAEQSHFSESYLRGQFRRRRGISAGRFLRELRLSEAEMLLRQSDLSLKEISARVGYSDVVAFHRAFSRMFHLTPANYRKRAYGMI